MAIIDDFREGAVPRLREVAKTQALFVALELVTLDEARAEVAAMARTLGARLLPSKDQDRLFDAWIPEIVLAELGKATDRVIVIEQRMDAAIRDQPARFYDGLAARCADPERMRWTFASMSKPYRKHLNQERNRARKA